MINPYYCEVCRKIHHNHDINTYKEHKKYSMTDIDSKNRYKNGKYIFSKKDQDEYENFLNKYEHDTEDVDYMVSFPSIYQYYGIKYSKKSLWDYWYLTPILIFILFLTLIWILEHMGIIK